MTQAMLRERLQMVTLNIIQFKISIYCYIYIGKRNIYIYVKSQSCGNLCHNLTDFKIWSIFKDRMDIYGRSLVVPARDSSTLQGAYQAVSIQRQKKCLQISSAGIISTFSMRLPAGGCGKPDQVDHDCLTAPTRCTSGLLSGPKPIPGTTCPHYLALQPTRWCSRY